MKIEMMLGIALLISIGILITSITINAAIINRLREKNRYYHSAKYRHKMFEQELILRNKMSEK